MAGVCATCAGRSPLTRWTLWTDLWSSLWPLVDVVVGVVQYDCNVRSWVNVNLLTQFLLNGCGFLNTCQILAGWAWTDFQSQYSSKRIPFPLMIYIKEDFEFIYLAKNLILWRNCNRVFIVARSRAEMTGELISLVD